MKDRAHIAMVSHHGARTGCSLPGQGQVCSRRATASARPGTRPELLT